MKLPSEVKYFSDLDLHLVSILGTFDLRLNVPQLGLLVVEVALRDVPEVLDSLALELEQVALHSLSLQLLTQFRHQPLQLQKFNSRLSLSDQTMSL